MIKISEFKEANSTYVSDEDDTEINAYHDEGSPKGRVVTVWAIGWLDRLYILVFGKLYLEEDTYNEPLTLKALYSRKYKIFDKKLAETKNI